MKRITTILSFLMLVCMGAWAASPATGAYPVEGKTYYLFANKYNSTDRYYLYWDNTNSALKRADANSKENTDYYKWTVSVVNDHVYTITNVGTKTKLTWNDSKGLTLGSGTDFDLSQQVAYTACVSLYAEVPHFCCVNNDVATFSNSYKFSTYSGTNTTYSTNFVFEEVLPAHSLTDGSYYTIYCDNDDKQYMYDNAGTLSVGSASTDFKYVWQCIVSGDYYNFRNLATGKYLGWKAMASSAYNYTVNTDKALHDGCATLWGVSESRNFSIKEDGSFGQTSDKDNKVTSVWCTDFRFDAVDMSGWCTGNLLGGSISDTGWKNLWTSSAATHSFTMEASAANINNSGSKPAGGLDIRSGMALSSTYTFKAPSGYIITGYKIVGYALSNNDQTITPAGGSATVFTKNGNSLSVSGLNHFETSFTLTGKNDGLFVRALQVSLKAVTCVTDLSSLSNTKAYVIMNSRAAWQFEDDATAMSATTTGYASDDETKQIAIINKDSYYYLFSVNEGKYLTADNTLTTAPTDNERVTISATSNARYPWKFNFTNVSNRYINVNSEPSVVINAHSTTDEGNSNAIIEAAAFSATDALAMFETADITYKLSYGGNSTFKTASGVTVRRSGDPADFLPAEWNKDFVSYSYDPEVIGSSTTEVTVTATWNGPFEISSSFASAEWYVIHMRQGGYNLKYTNADATYYPLEAAALLTESNLYKWAFIGDPFDGFQIVNEGAGSDNTLYAGASPANGGYPLMSSSNTTKWIVNGNPKNSEAGGFGLQPSGASVYINDYAGGKRLSFWQDNTSKDVGSTLTVQKFYPALVAVKISPYFDSIGKYFSLSASAEDLVAKGNAWAAAKTSCSKSTYDDLLSYVTNTANIRYPATGYYRIKNVNSGNYIGYGTAGYSGKGNGLIEVAASDASSIIKLTGSNGVYTMSTQGLNAQQQSTRNAVVPATSSAGADYTFTVLAPEVVSIRADLSDAQGYLFRSSWGSAPESVITWDASSDAAKWKVEDAESHSVSLTAIGDNTYATTCLPFDVTVKENTITANAVLVSDVHVGYVVPTALEDNKIPAGTPVILKGSSTSATSATLTINKSSAFSAISETSALEGVYVNTDFALTDGSTTDYFLGMLDGALGFYHSGVASKSGYYTLGANKAYLPSSAASRGFAIKWNDDEVTGIRSIDNGKQSVKNGAFYDLSGRRVENPQHGMYIVNGRVVVIK